MDGDTRETIRAVALELFSAKGFEQTSLREIAERVGLTKASLYYHYSSKQDLLRAIMGTFFDDMAAMFRRVESVPWSPEAERELLAAYLDVVIKHRGTGPTLLRDIAAVLAAFGDDLDDLIAQSRRFQAWLAGPDPTPRDRVLAAAALEVVGAVMSSSLSPQQLSDADLRVTLLDAATAVLASRDRARTA